MKLSGIPFYPAHSSNYTKGRGGRTLKYFTVHHTAGMESTLRHVWANPNRNSSSHFFVSNKLIEQYVDTDDTAWTNGNFTSNQESVTVETRGDWRNNYHDQSTLNQLEDLMYRCLQIYPHLKITYHMDVKSGSTLCPADLKHKGYALTCWNNAQTRLAYIAPPEKSKITYEKITPKRVEMKNTANLWDFNFTKWSDAKAVKTFQAGELVDVVAIATNELGGRYYMTAYSYNNGEIRATNGFNVADVKDYVPKPAPKPKAGEEPNPKPKEDPIDKDPTTPGNGDVEERLSALEKAMAYILDFLKNIFNNFNFKK